MVRFGSFAPSMRIGAYGDVYLAGYLRVLDDEVRTDTLMFSTPVKVIFFCHSTADKKSELVPAHACQQWFQLTGHSTAVECPQLKQLQQPVCIRSRSGTAEESASAVAAAAAAAAAVVVTVVAAPAAVAATATQVAGAWCISSY